ERGKDQVTAVGVALRNAQLVAVFHGGTDGGDIREVNLWIHALGQHIQTQGHQVYVAGALTVAEQAAFDAVRTGQVAQLRCGNAFAAVIVWVQGQDDGVTLGEVAVHPLNGIRVDIRGNHLQRGRQIDAHRICWSGFNDGDDGVADIDGEIQLRGGERFWGVLPAPV